MPIDISTLWVFRITHRLNLPYILEHGLYYRNNPNFPPNYINIGNPDIISSRDTKPVPCYPNTTVNDYVPFYFAVRTPMLYNIHTGYGVPRQDQNDIIYLCCKVDHLVQGNLQWCFTDGNAAQRFTVFYNDLANLDDLDWRSIRTTDFRDDNADGDTGRKRKKHAEFLVHNYVPIEYVGDIVVHGQQQYDQVTTLIAQYGRNITVHINPNQKFYF